MKVKQNDTQCKTTGNNIGKSNMLNALDSMSIIFWKLGIEMNIN